MSRVVMVTPSPAEPGGIASVVSVLLSSPLAQRYDISVVPTVRGGGAVRHLRGAWGVMRACAAVSRTDTCLVHLHVSVGASFTRKSLVARWAALMGKPTILHLHGGRFESWVDAGGPSRRQAVSRAFAAADRVVVLSEAWRLRVSEITGHTDAVVVPNPVVVPAHVTTGTAARHVVYLGRLDERKGIDDLLSAIRRLQEAGVESRWTLAGDGEIERVRREVSTLPDPSAVDVPGWLPARDVRGLLGAASVLCLPSYDEGLPMAMLEAMAFGLTCVVTPVGGIPDVIEDGVDGVIVPTGDADELSRALQRVLEDPESRRRMGAQARRKAEERFSERTVASELEAVYVSLGCMPAERPC